MGSNYVTFQAKCAETPHSGHKAACERSGQEFQLHLKALSNTKAQGLTAQVSSEQ